MLEETSEATTKKVPMIRKMPLRRWQTQTHRLMSNRKQILRAKCAGKALLSPALSLPRRHLHAISSNGFLEYTRARRHHHRRLRAGAEQANDHPTRTMAAVYSVSYASDRATPFVL